jgi:hypothetical protein
VLILEPRRAGGARKAPRFAVAFAGGIADDAASAGSFVPRRIDRPSFRIAP